MNINEYLPSYYFSLNLYLALLTPHPKNPINLQDYEENFPEQLKNLTQSPQAFGVRTQNCPEIQNNLPNNSDAQNIDLPGE